MSWMTVDAETVSQQTRVDLKTVQRWLGCRRATLMRFPMRESTRIRIRRYLGDRAQPYIG